MINIGVRFSGRVTCSLSHLEQTAGNGTAYQSARPMTSPTSLEGPATGSPEAPQPLWETGPRLAGRKKWAPLWVGKRLPGGGGLLPAGRGVEVRRGEEKETNGDPRPPCDGGADAAGAGTTSALSPQPSRPAPRPARPFWFAAAPQSDGRDSQSKRVLPWGGGGLARGEGPSGPAERSRRRRRSNNPPAWPLSPRCAMEDVLPPGLLEICLLVGVPRERVRALLQVRGAEVRWGSAGRAGGSAVPAGRVSRPVCGAGSVSAGLSPVPVRPLPSARTRVRLWGCLVAVIIG